MSRHLLKTYGILLLIALCSVCTVSLTHQIWISRSEFVNILLAATFPASLRATDLFLVYCVIAATLFTGFSEPLRRRWNFIFIDRSHNRHFKTFKSSVALFNAMLTVLIAVTLPTIVNNFAFTSAFGAADMGNYEVGERVFSQIRSSEAKLAGVSLWSMNFNCNPFDIRGMDSRVDQFLTATYGARSTEVAEEYCRLADFLKRSGNVRKAETFYRKAISIFHEQRAIGLDSFATTMLGDLLINDGQVNSGRIYLRQAVRMLQNSDEQVQVVLIRDLRIEKMVPELQWLSHQPLRRSNFADDRALTPNTQGLSWSRLLLLFCWVPFAGEAYIVGARRRLRSKLQQNLPEVPL